MSSERNWSARLHCLLHGHDVSPTDTYGEQLPDGKIEELHYCRHCGVGVWMPGHAHEGVFPEPMTAHQLPDMVAPMAPPGSRQHISP